MAINKYNDINYGSDEISGPENIGRRRLLQGAIAGAAGLALGSSVTSKAFAEGSKQVVVRGLGGAYQDAVVKAICEPFTAATGIQVIVQPATPAQIRAMVQTNRVSIDVGDFLDVVQIGLDKIGALVPIDYAGMKYTNPNDIRPTVRRPNMVGNLYFATVMAYNTDVYKPGTQPRSWAEFWDLKKFPGARTLADQRTGSAELEFALLASGVPAEKLYPLDIDRAFASLDKIKPAIAKWWDTGAISAQLLSRKEAVLGGLWNGRVQALIDQGAPLAIEWNQAKQQLQYWSIIKGAPNMANAQKFVDFALQPKIQAELTRYIAYGPTNTKAFDYVRPEDLAKLPSAPEHYKSSFELNPTWWSDNLTAVGDKWQSWVMRGA
ncbi:ABC transporter substrate-binding protein [Paraburkholderia tropica]|uniref:ABC transporter substrate-binding protein n=1 Tax=Paraburkholderia tropica TaxID=92647 RepID=UPI002AB79B25|nr:ABC transporter substrate-binding protein [Paraburkholderia tropica]